MDFSKGQGSFSSQYLPGRRSREERRSLSETLADGTSKFFSSMVAKKNGLFSDISNKIENTFAPKTDTISNSTGSDVSVSPPTTPPASAPVQRPSQQHPSTHSSQSNTAVPNTPPPRPPPPKRLPSMGSSQERTTTVIKRMSSMPAYSRTESRGESDYVPIPPTGRGTSSYKDGLPNNKYNIGGMNVSFDQPIYGQQREPNETEKSAEEDSNKPTRVTHTPNVSKSEFEESEKYANQQNTRIISNNSTKQSVTHSTAGNTNTQDPYSDTPSTFSSQRINSSYNTENTNTNTSSIPSKSQPVPAPRRSPGNNTSNNNNINNAVGNNKSSSPTMGTSSNRDMRAADGVADRKQNLRREMNKSSSSGEWSDRRQTSEESNKSCQNERYSDSSGSGEKAKKKTPKLTTARRSSTVDEMLFDDYVDPEVDAVLPPSDTPPENLISFEPDIEVTRSDSSGTEGNGNNRGMLGSTSVDSSDVEYGGVVPRSGSMGSDKSWSSSYSVDSQPDDLTLECMEFMKSFVDKVFQNGEEISQTDKAKYGELCQYFPGRLWFSRYVNSQVVYITATLPYLLLTVMLILGCTLPGAGDGVLFYIRPDFSKLLILQTWVEAAIQVFYSLGPAWGGLITMASYNKFNNNCMRDSILLTIACEGTSIYGGFAIFTILGHMAYNAGVPITDFAKSGPGLAFIVYPQAVSYLPIPQLWGFLFFLMLFTLGLDSQFTNVETILTTLADVWPKFVCRWRKTISVLVMVTFTLAGLFFASRGGIYFFTLMDWYIAAFTLLPQATLECVIVAWIYGSDKFCSDIELMTGRKVPFIFVYAWKYITPFLLMILFAITLAFYKPPSYENYIYPMEAQLGGWLFAIAPFSAIVVVAIIQLRKQEGSLAERFKKACRPTTQWVPALTEIREKYFNNPEITSLNDIDIQHRFQV